MANSDDEKPKDNISPRLKPKSAQNKTLAPNGNLGIRGLDLPSQFSSTHQILDITVRVAVDGSVAKEQTDAEKRAEYLETLPESTSFTAVTTDKDVDRKSIKDGDVPVTQEEMDALKANKAAKKENVKPEGPKVSQSDFAKAFRDAQDRTWELQQKNDHEIE
jgi:hypothetical protein